MAEVTKMMSLGAELCLIFAGGYILAVIIVLMIGNGRIPYPDQMSAIVERMARAMCEKSGTAWADTSDDEDAPALISRPFWLQQARTAIAEALLKNHRIAWRSWRSDDG
jgi:hypothetical protein